MADMIFVEDINFKMTTKGFLSKQMLDRGFGQFRDLLSWVCWKRGKYLAQVDHRHTSQICPECGTHTGKKELGQIVHICSECSYQTSRDHASSRVILNRGLETVVPVDCGERKLSGNAVPGWGEYFAKVYLLRPKIKCNSPHSRPGQVFPHFPIRGQARASPNSVVL